MAINDQPTPSCTRYWRHEPGPPAVALVLGDRTGSDGEYWPECQSCLDERIVDPDPLPHDVVYLDPTRQRRSQSDPDRPEYICVHTDNGIVGPACFDHDPAPGHHPSHHRSTNAMTSETEPGIPDVTAAYGGPFTFEYRRVPDAVRAAALANAVDIACAQIKAGGATTIDIIVADAVGFEAYLTGEEAHDTP